MQFEPATAGVPDKLHRASLARRIAEQLILPPLAEGYVVGLEGEWGSGKSWLIDQILIELSENSERPVVFQFNPWQIDTESDLILTFLVQLAVKLGGNKVEQAKTVGRSLLAYARVLRHAKYLKYVPVPGLQQVGQVVDDYEDGIAKAFDAADSVLQRQPTMSLQDARTGVVSALAGFSLPLIVVIDDLDRLRPAEIRAVVQLVKSVGAFRRTAYLMAYSHTEISRALADGHSAERGAQYLKKIVQLQIQVPMLRPYQRRELLREAIDRLSPATGQAHARKDTDERQEAAMDILQALLLHPRDVFRWEHRLRWVLPVLNGSVALADLMVAEALQQEHPESLRMLDEHFQLFFGVTNELSMFAAFHGRLREEARQDQIEKCMGLVAVPPVRKALEWLIPSARNSKTSANARSQCLLADHMVWTRYRQFVRIDGFIDSETAHTLLNNAGDLLRALNGESRSGSTGADLIIAISTWLDPHRLTDPASCQAALFQWVTSQDWDSVSGRLKHFEKEACCELAHRVIKSLPSEAQVQQLHHWVDNLELEFACVFARVAKGRAMDEAMVEPPVAADLLDRVCRRVHLAIETRSFLTMAKPISVVYWHRKLTSFPEACRLLDVALSLDEDFLLFISSYAKELDSPTFQVGTPFECFQDPFAAISRLTQLRDTSPDCDSLSRLIDAAETAEGKSFLDQSLRRNEEGVNSEETSHQ